MGNFLNDLKAAKSAPAAIRLQFRVEYQETGDDVYAFFESTDDVSFYRNEITKYIRASGRLKSYLCGNKKSVWYHYEFAEKVGKLRNCIFFVDKDLDDFTGLALPRRQQIFVTEYYAVENYLCSETSIFAVLEELIFLPDRDDIHKKIARTFQEGIDIIASHLRPIFSEVILLRRLNIDISFSDFGDSLAPCFELKELMPNPLPGWDQIFRTRCKYDVSKILAEDIEKMSTRLAEANHHQWMRGKFALWFFLQFIDRVWTSVVGSQINDKKKIKKTVELKPDNVFLVMQGRHLMPNGLSAFLSQNIFLR